MSFYIPIPSLFWGAYNMSSTVTFFLRNTMETVCIPESICIEMQENLPCMDRFSSFKNRRCRLNIPKLVGGLEHVLFFHILGILYNHNHV